MLVRNTKANAKVLKAELDTPENRELSCSQLAEKYNVSYSTASTLAKRFIPGYTKLRPYSIPVSKIKKIVKDLYTSDLPLRAYAEEKGYNYTTLAHWSRTYLSNKRYQEILQRTVRKVNEELPKRARDLYESGMSVIEFAHDRGYSQVSVARWSREMLSPEKHKEVLKRKANLPSYLSDPNERKKLVKELLASDLPAKDFAGERNLSQGTLLFWAKGILSKKGYLSILKRTVPVHSDNNTPIDIRNKVVQDWVASGLCLKAFSDTLPYNSCTVSLWAKDVLTDKEYNEVITRAKQKKALKEERESIVRELYNSLLSIKDFAKAHPTLTSDRLISWSRKILTKEQHKEVLSRRARKNSKKDKDATQLDLWDGVAQDVFKDLSRASRNMAATPKKTNTQTLPKSATKMLQDMGVTQVLQDAQDVIQRSSQVIKELSSMVSTSN
jgi:transposase